MLCYISLTETKFSRGLWGPSLGQGSSPHLQISHWISHTMAGREQPWPSILTQEWSQLVGRWINPKYRSIHLHLRSAYPRLEWRFTDFNLLCMIRWMPVMNETGLVCCVYREPSHNVRWQWLPPCHQDPWNHNERSLQVIHPRTPSIVETLRTKTSSYCRKQVLNYSKCLACSISWLVIMLSWSWHGFCRPVGYVKSQNKILIRCFVTHGMHFLHHCPSRPLILPFQKPLITWQLLRCLSFFWWRGLFIRDGCHKRRGTETKALL